MDEVFLKQNYQKNYNLCLADIQRTLKPKQMWEVLQISPSQSHAGAFSVPVKKLRLGSQYQIRDSALALWQRGTFHEEPQWELSEACQHHAVSSSWVRDMNAHSNNHRALCLMWTPSASSFSIDRRQSLRLFCCYTALAEMLGCPPASHRLSWASVGLFAPSVRSFAPKLLSFKTNFQDGFGYDRTDVVSSHQNSLSVFLIHS